MIDVSWLPVSSPAWIRRPKVNIITVPCADVVLCPRKWNLLSTKLPLSIPAPCRWELIVPSAAVTQQINGIIVILCLLVYCTSAHMELRWNGRHFAEDLFKLIFVNKNCCISNQISLTFVPKLPFDNKSALVQAMARHRLSDRLNQWRPISQTDICVIRSMDVIKYAQGIVNRITMSLVILRC